MESTKMIRFAFDPACKKLEDDTKKQDWNV